MFLSLRAHWGGIVTAAAVRQRRHCLHTTAYIFG